MYVNSKDDGMDKRKLLKALKADLKSAERLRKEQDEKIATYEKEYNGEPYGNEEDGKSAIVSRDIKKQSEWQHSTLVDPFVSTPDIIKASPITFEDRKAARTNELLDRQGTLVIQTGWAYETAMKEVAQPIYMKDQLGNLMPDANGQPIQTGTEMVEKEITVVNKPTAKVCRNEDVFIDPTAQDDIDNAQFFIYRYETDMSTLKQDGRYKNLDKVAKANDNEDVDYETEDDTEFEFEDEARKKLVVYEYWGNYDRNEDGIAEPIVCAWIGNTVIRLEDNPFPDGKAPFIVVPFNSVPFSMYGEPNAALISDNQKIKTAMLRGIIDNVAQSNSTQRGLPKGELDSKNAKLFLAGENFEFNHSSQGFYQGDYNPIPTSVFNVFDLMNNDIESITATKSFSQGISGGSLGPTATGVRGALDATSTRKLNIIRNIAENMIKPLLRKWMSYNAEFLDEEQTIRITNDNFITIHPEDMEGRIDIDIKVTTAEDNASKAQELAFMVQTLGNNADEGMRKLLLSEIARLQKMPDLAKQIEDYKPQPNPMAEKEAMLRMELLQAQVQNEYAKAGENEVDIRLKTAKALNEEAQTRSVHSKADLDDQAFLEKDSGADHEKELDKKQLEHAANMDLAQANKGQNE